MLSSYFRERETDEGANSAMETRLSVSANTGVDKLLVWEVWCPSCGQNCRGWGQPVCTSLSSVVRGQHSVPLCSHRGQRKFEDPDAWGTHCSALPKFLKRESVNIQNWLAAPSRYTKTGWHLSFPEGICGLNSNEHWTKLGETGSFFKLPNVSSGLMPTASWAPLTPQLINLEQKRLLLHKCCFQERVEAVSHVVRAGPKLPSSRWKLPYLSFLASITAVKRRS